MSEIEERSFTIVGIGFFTALMICIFVGYWVENICKAWKYSSDAPVRFVERGVELGGYELEMRVDEGVKLKANKSSD